MDRTVTASIILGMDKDEDRKVQMDEPCTPEQIESIRRAALARAAHFLALADALDDFVLSRQFPPGRYPLLEESAAQLRQLGGEE